MFGADVDEVSLKLREEDPEALSTALIVGLDQVPSDLVPGYHNDWFYNYQNKVLKNRSNAESLLFLAI